MNLPGILRIDLAAKGEVAYQISACDRLWLPEKLIMGGQIVTNPVGVLLGVKVEDRNNDSLPFGLANGFVNSFSGGKMTVLYVTVLYNPAGSTEMFLQTANGVGIGYCSADGLSPVVQGDISEFGRR